MVHVVLRVQAVLLDAGYIGTRGGRRSCIIGARSSLWCYCLGDEDAMIKWLSSAVGDCLLADV
jgi:hypothetical protein